MRGFHSVLKLHPEAVLRQSTKILGFFTALLIFLSLIIYGMSIYFENRILKTGKDSRDVHEDNQELQITLDRLQSFEKVAEASSNIQGLETASEVIDIASQPKHRFVSSDRPPRRALPKEIYGY